MKKFDLQAALDGAPCRTRDGRKAFVRHYERDLNIGQVLLGIVQCVPGSQVYVPRQWQEGGLVYSKQVRTQDIIGMWEPEFKHWDLFDPCIISLTVGTSCKSDSGLLLQAKTRDGSMLHMLHLAAHLITDPAGTVYTR